MYTLDQDDMPTSDGHTSLSYRFSEGDHYTLKDSLPERLIRHSTARGGPQEKSASKARRHLLLNWTVQTLRVVCS